MTENIDKTNGQHSEMHEYDGIVELNNPAPNWVLIVFFVTIWFSLLYVIIYFGYPNNGKDQKSEYITAVETANAEKAENLKNSNALASLPDTEMALIGKQLYAEKSCIACHGVNGEGNNIGPNLTDKFWLYGCNIDEVSKIISEGKVEKGMTAFKNSLTPIQIKQISLYITQTLAGTNPANAKAPQGVECK